MRRAVATLELGAEEAARIGGEVIPLDLTEAAGGFVGGYTRVPAGPVIAMAPFNFPLNLVCHKLAPALASGCSLVLKPPPGSAHGVSASPTSYERRAPPRARFRFSLATPRVAEKLVRDDRFATSRLPAAPA